MIDYRTGVHLNAERTELGATKYWMTIEGEDKGLSARQYETMMNLLYDARMAERERIIKLLEPYIGCRDDLCYPYCSCRRSEFAIALIKGDQQ
jgi:hypothetical protein